MRALPIPRDSDVLLAFGAVVACGVGAALALAGAASGGLAVGLVGGGALALGLIVILAARWLDPFIVLIVSLPLPAFYSTTAFRLAPALGVTSAVIVAWLLRLAIEPRALDTSNTTRLREAALLGSAVLVAAAFAQDRGAAAREVVNWVLLLGLYLFAARELRVPARRHALARAIGIVVALSGGCVCVLPHIRQ